MSGAIDCVWISCPVAQQGNLRILNLILMKKVKENDQNELQKHQTHKSYKSIFLLHVYQKTLLQILFHLFLHTHTICYRNTAQSVYLFAAILVNSFLLAFVLASCPAGAVIHSGKQQGKNRSKSNHRLNLLS